MTHSTISLLQQKYEQAADFVEVGALYFHYRSPQVFYKVLALGLQEATEEPCVIYQNSENQVVWVRNLSDWRMLVDLDGRTVPRFQKV